MLMIHHLASQRQTAELRSISYLWEVMYSIQLQCALKFKKNSNEWKVQSCWQKGSCPKWQFEFNYK